MGESQTIHSNTQAGESKPCGDDIHYGQERPRQTVKSTRYRPHNQENGNNALAIASLVTGILSFFFAAPISSILAIVFAVMSKKRGKNKLATAGMACGISSLVLSITAIIFFAVLTKMMGGIFVTIMEIIVEIVREIVRMP